MILTILNLTMQLINNLLYEELGYFFPVNEGELLSMK